eukprot:2330805-Prymnesium_polylepis.2
MGVVNFWPKAAALAHPINLHDGSCRGERWAIDSNVALHAAIAHPTAAWQMVVGGDLAPSGAVSSYLQALRALLQHDV